MTRSLFQKKNLKRKSNMTILGLDDQGLRFKFGFEFKFRFVFGFEFRFRLQFGFKFEFGF